jgi:hypothetical protein
MDAHEKAFEYAGETVRQVLTLATGVIALTVTFAKDIIEPGSAALPWMKWGWTLFGVSIFFGILTLMAITGQLHAAAAKVPAGNPDMYAPNIRLFASLQIWLCFVALVLTIRFGIIGMNEGRQRKAVVASPPAVTVACTPCAPGTATPSSRCVKGVRSKDPPLQHPPPATTTSPKAAQPTPATRTTT